MKKTLLAFILFSGYLITKAQNVTFLSLGSTTVEKDAKGSFADAKIWIIKEMHINVNLSQNKLQFYSKGMFDRDTFSLQKQVVMLRKIATPDTDQTIVFSGIDESKRTCILRFKAVPNEYVVSDGELQVEYPDHAEIYRLRKMSQHPSLNKTSHKLSF